MNAKERFYNKSVIMGAEDFGRVFVSKETNARIVGIRMNEIFSGRIAGETDDS